MTSKRLQYQGRDSGEYPPRYEDIGYYDVDQALERRYQQRQAGLAWQHRMEAFGNWLVSVFHLPAAHPHPKLAHAHRTHHR